MTCLLAVCGKAQKVCLAKDNKKVFLWDDIGKLCLLASVGRPNKVCLWKDHKKVCFWENNGMTCLLAVSWWTRTQQQGLSLRRQRKGLSLGEQRDDVSLGCLLMDTYTATRSVSEKATKRSVFGRTTGYHVCWLSPDGHNEVCLWEGTKSSVSGLLCKEITQTSVFGKTTQRSVSAKTQQKGLSPGIRHWKGLWEDSRSPYL